MDNGFWAMGMLILFLSTIPAYLTHLFWSLHGLFSGTFTETAQYVVACLGAFLPPVGVLHGYYLWFS